MTPTRNNHNKGKVVLVLGGNGFIGRHIVKHLKYKGMTVIIGTRNASTSNCGKGELRNTSLHKKRSHKEWVELIDGVDVVINSVGILRQRPGETFDLIHHRAVAAMTKACAEVGSRFIHVSILGADAPARSRYVASKLNGEKAVTEFGTDWFIVRPSLVEGDGGFGARWFRRVAKWPIHFAPSNAVGKLSPIPADRLGESIAKLAADTSSYLSREERIVELGGDNILSLLEYLKLLNSGKKPWKIIMVPAWCARLISHICDLLHLTPYSFGHYELLQYRNYPERYENGILLQRPTNDNFGEPVRA